MSKKLREVTILQSFNECFDVNLDIRSREVAYIQFSVYVRVLSIYKGICEVEMSHLLCYFHLSMSMMLSQNFSLFVYAFFLSLKASMKFNVPFYQMSSF